METHQFCAYTADSSSIRLALRLIQSHGFEYEVHIMRTRFWVPVDHPYYTFCALRFKNVDGETDHALGI